MKLLFVALMIAFVTGKASAQMPTDQPGQGETFSQFFRRITTMGAYSGISLDAPAGVEQRFLNWFRLGAWVGADDQARRVVQNQGVDVYLGWYRENHVLPILFPGNSLQLFASAFESRRTAGCSSCRSFSDLEKLTWSDWKTPERENFTLTFVQDVPLFGGKTLIDILAEGFGLSGASVKARTTARLLSHADFVQAVHDLGWNGDVYFRGLTTVDPKQPHHDVIVLDDEFLRTQTEYSQPIFQALELAGTLTHEFAHAFQDAESDSFGIDLQVGSLAGSLLIEGDAEFNAERALTAASHLMPSPNPLALYSAEQAIELMDKDTQVQFIPYRVGLPLVIAVQDQASKPFRMELYQTILGNRTLAEFAADAFPKPLLMSSRVAENRAVLIGPSQPDHRAAGKN